MKMVHTDSTKISEELGASIITKHDPEPVPSRIVSSGMLRRVALVRTNVLEELGASIR
jgi:hypothetical protein